MADTLRREGMAARMPDFDPDKENWFLLLDPLWEPAEPVAEPPVEVIMGVWPVTPDGVVTRFTPNPEYAPVDPHAPTDPLDAALRSMAVGETEPEQVRQVMRDCLFDIALDEDGRPMLVLSPDDVACVLVATSYPHRERVETPGWVRVALPDLVALLRPDEGSDEAWSGDEGRVDVYLNPGARSATRLTAEFITGADDAPHPADAAEPEAIPVYPWDIDGFARGEN